MNLSERKNTVILHYGCADFNKSVHTIFSIGAQSIMIIKLISTFLKTKTKEI